MKTHGLHYYAIKSISFFLFFKYIHFGMLHHNIFVKSLARNFQKFKLRKHFFSKVTHLCKILWN